MSLIDKPEPGELVKTVAELVDAVNGGGSGGVGKLCWFEAPNLAGGSGTSPTPWSAISDGVAPFTDAKVNVDPSWIEIVTTGTYIINIDCFFRNQTATLARAQLLLARNDDSVGPLYDLISEYTVPAGDINAQEASLHLGCPVDLNAGDILRPVILDNGVPSSYGAWIFTLIKVA